MNYGLIRNVISKVMKIEAILMLLPVLVGLIYKENSVVYVLASAILCFALGTLVGINSGKDKAFRATEGYVSVALSWIILSIFGSLPYLLSGQINSVVDALFETSSGFTTTGASIIKDVEIVPKCILFWRSFTNWIGGMGVLVFVLAVLPISGESKMYLMQAESPGPSIEKLVPRLKSTAMILYGIYTFITMLGITVLIVAGMPVFDAITSAFAAAGTGGFAIRNSSMADYSSTIQIIITVMMIACGINFNIYFLVVSRKWKSILKSEELRAYLGIIVISIAIISVSIYSMYDSLFDTVKHASFQVGSVMTTTGFATTDFNQWSSLPKAILLVLMMIGASAGSTGGGIKVSRFLIMIKTTFKEIFTFIHPHGVKKVKMDGRIIEHETLRKVNVFFITYVIILIASTLLISIDNFSFETNFSAVMATFNNIGPGLDQVGPVCNYSMYSDFSKLVMIFDMIAGRLEIFPMLILFSHKTWVKN